MLNCNSEVLKTLGILMVSDTNMFVRFIDRVNKFAWN